MEKEKLKKLKNSLLSDKDARKEASFISQDLISVLTLATANATHGGKLSKAITIGSTLMTVGSALSGAWKFYKNHTTPETYVIKITEDDAIFDTVEEWFMEALPEDSQRSVYAHSSITKRDKEPTRRGRLSRGAEGLYEDEPSTSSNDLPDENKVTIDYSFDGTIVQTLEIAGHTVDVYTAMPESKVGAENKNGFHTNRTINIVCKSVTARNEVLDEIENQSQHLTQNQPRMYVSGRWGEFRKRSAIQPRSRESVILKEGQMERILGHLNTFLSNKDAYQKADLPFRTGILLYGEPGSGKSSTALAIANELKMNVYIITLSALMSDESLNDCFASIPRNSIVILEDIDIAHSTKDRDDDDNGVTMSGLLNVLDGFQSPPGVITIMTTNRLDVLDEAVIRPGRVDLKENLDCLDSYQLRGICEYFTGSVPENLPEITPSDRITSAEIMGEIRKHLPDFENASEDIVNFVNKKLLTSRED
jgi:ATPase family associated with various cellular activities (AAA)